MFRAREGVRGAQPSVLDIVRAARSRSGDAVANHAGRSEAGMWPPASLSAQGDSHTHRHAPQRYLDMGEENKRIYRIEKEKYERRQNALKQQLALVGGGDEAACNPRGGDMAPLGDNSLNWLPIDDAYCGGATPDAALAAADQDAAIAAAEAAVAAMGRHDGIVPPESPSAPFSQPIVGVAVQAASGTHTPACGEPDTTAPDQDEVATC